MIDIYTILEWLDLERGEFLVNEQLISFGSILVMFVALWFMLIRPAQKRQKQTQEMQGKLKRGDKVVTVGGLHGVIESLEDTAVVLKVADNTVVKFERQAIGRVISE